MLLKKWAQTEKRGLLYGSFSPIMYSIDSVLDILLFAVVFGLNYRSQMSLWQTITYAFITSFFKDFCLFIFMHFRAKTNVTKQFFVLAKNKRRAFWWTILGSICGGPLGFSLTTATILYSGAAYGSALANFSPVIVLLFAKMFFKTKLTIYSWIGVFLAISGFVGLSFYSSFLNGEGFGFNLRIFIGVIMAILAVLTWSVETIIAEFTEKFGEEQSLNDNEKLIIKSTISSSANLFIFIPLSLLFSLIAKENKMVFAMLETLFQSWASWLILIIIGIIVVIGRSSYWFAISRIGGGRADILYYLTVLITPLLTLFLWAIGVEGFEQPEGVKLWPYWTLLIIQITGVFLITFFSKNNKQHIYTKNKK